MSHEPRVNTALTRYVGCSCGWQIPPGTEDSDTAFIEHVATNSPPDLKEKLVEAAVAWAHAEDDADYRSAALAAVNDAIAEAPMYEELSKRLEQVKLDFHLADQRAQECDVEFRRAARQIAVTREDRLVKLETKK